jgi:hypothetical protein
MYAVVLFVCDKRVTRIVRTKWLHDLEKKQRSKRPWYMCYYSPNIDSKVNFRSAYHNNKGFKNTTGLYKVYIKEFFGKLKHSLYSNFRTSFEDKEQLAISFFLKFYL